MPARITARIDGVKALLRDLVDDPVHAKPWTDALEEGAGLAEKALKHYAPGTSTKGQTKTALGKGAVPKWGRARMPNRLTGSKGKKVRVMGMLHGSRRIKFHYRTGPLPGGLTYDWFEKARKSVEGQTVKLLTRAESQIESRWGRK